MVTVTTKATSKCTRNKRIMNRESVCVRTRKEDKSRGVPLTLPPLLRCLDLRYSWEVVPPEPSPPSSGRLARLGVTCGVCSGGNPASATGAAASPPGGLGSVTFGLHLLDFPDIVVDWRGFALGGVRSCARDARPQPRPGPPPDHRAVWWDWESLSRSITRA
jgi:hypothetical protein